MNNINLNHNQINEIIHLDNIDINSKSTKELFKKHKILVVSNIEHLKEENILSFLGLLITIYEVEKIIEIINFIRNNENIHISLKPVFLLDNEDFMISEYFFDGKFKKYQQEEIIKSANKIQKKLQNINYSIELDRDNLIKFKLLSYLYSREKELKPFISRNFSTGYSYFILGLMNLNMQMTSLLQILNNIVKKGYLDFELHDIIHLCKKCNKNYLNYREVCPKCHSIDIIGQDIIHHFVCAYVAPESDFIQDDRLECPKCNKTLRHIGIDYDKPSVMYKCQTCSSEFQETSMIVKCMDCQTENEINHLVQNNIGIFELSDQGKNWLCQSHGNNLNLYKSDNSNIELFKILLKQEILRVKDKNIKSYLFHIVLKGEALEKCNDDYKNELKQEISDIIKSYLLPSNVLSAIDYNSYYILLIDTDKPELKTIDRIEYNLRELCADNLEFCDMTLEIRKHEINMNDSYSDLILFE